MGDSGMGLSAMSTDDPTAVEADFNMKCLLQSRQKRQTSNAGVFVAVWAKEEADFAHAVCASEIEACCALPDEVVAEVSPFWMIFGVLSGGDICLLEQRSCFNTHSSEKSRSAEKHAKQVASGLASPVATTR